MKHWIRSSFVGIWTTSQLMLGSEGRMRKSTENDAMKSVSWKTTRTEKLRGLAWNLWFLLPFQFHLLWEVPHIDEGLTFFSGGANGREWRRKNIYIKFNSISSSLYLSSLLLDRQYNAFRFHSLLFFRLRCRSLLSAKGSPIRRRWIRKISFYSLPPELSF